MQQVLIVIHLMVVIALVGTVLLQRSEGGGLGMGGGGGGGVSGFLTGRGQANALTRATAILAAAFFTTSILLSVLAGVNRAPRSILDRAGPAAGQPGAPGAPATETPGGGQGDFLKRLDGTGGAPPAPEAPQAPISR